MRIADFAMAARPKPEKPAEYARFHEKILAPPRVKAAAEGVETRRWTLTVCDSLAAVERQWNDFEQKAYATFYQSFLWCRAWCETVGKANHIDIRIVTAQDHRGEMVFILPLQIRRRLGVRVLEWLGTPHTTYGYGLVAPNFLGEAQEWFSRYWTQIVRLAGPADAVFLDNMPDVLDGESHPLRQLFNLCGPNRCYRMALISDYGALLCQKRSKETRRYYRKKERAFTMQGNLSFELPSSREETQETLRIMFAQQEKRLGERGIHGVFGPIERDFIHRLADLQNQADPVFLPYMLKFNGQILAVLLGGVHANAFWAMISSLAETELRKYSPGDLALRRSIEASCKRGLAHFDFAAGDTPYKLHWADTVTPLYMMLATLKIRALPWVWLTGAKIIGKRLIKQSPGLRNAAMNLRRILLGTRLRRGPPPG